MLTVIVPGRTRLSIAQMLIALLCDLSAAICISYDASCVTAIFGISLEKHQIVACLHTLALSKFCTEDGSYCYCSKNTTLGAL